MDRVFNFDINLDWSLVLGLSEIDRFDAQWTAIKRREGDNLRQLKSVATIESTGASTRIEGSSLSNEQVDALLGKLDISKLEDRDKQEVVGYHETLDLILHNFDDIAITEGNIKNLHRLLMQFSSKDEWHRGDYKQNSNSVVARLEDGSEQVIFEATPPGPLTGEAMRMLVHWYNHETRIHSLVKIATFVYEFLSIHPFQDGNGRLSRLLTTLLLMQSGYTWIQYISFEHEIERQKQLYYNTLRQCQAGRPGENVSPWVNFFLSCIKLLTEKLLSKLKEIGSESQLHAKEKAVLAYVNLHPGAQSGDISKSLKMPLPTVKRLLKQLVDMNLIEKHGVGRGTYYLMC